MKPHPSSRRDFLKKSSLLAAPLIVPSSVFGKNAPSNRINLAAIGTGSRCNANVLPNFVKAMDDARVIVACDCFENRREGFAAKLNDYYGGKVCEAVADSDEVMARDDIDGVVISTIDHWHVPLAYRAALAGKDMYVEKPLSLAMSWAWKLREVVERKNVVFQYGTQQRSDGAFQRAIDLVRNGYIGKVERVEAWCPDMSSQFKAAKAPYGSKAVAKIPKGFDYERWIGPAPMKPYTVDRCTKFGGWHNYDYALGFIAGWGAHPLDIAQWGLGMDNSGPIRYEGSGLIPPHGSLWDSIESWDMQCEYANGVTMRFMGQRAAKEFGAKLENRPERDHGTTFFGTEGWVSVDRGGCYYNHRGQSQNAYTIEHQASDELVYKSPSQARNFVDCIKSRAATINPLESAIRSDTISHLSDICIRTGRSIDWDPTTETIRDDAEATKMLDRPMRQPWVM